MASSFRSSNPDSAILIAESLRKSYGRQEALRGLSFSLRSGRVLGLLGPNGAGKTTAIRILTTILEPSSGSFSVAGISSDDEEGIRRRIGVLPESLGFPKQISAIDYLCHFGQLYGRTAREARDNSVALLKEVGLEARATSLVGTFSRGMRQRLGIARSLVHDPAVVILDEPTLGLDPRGQQELLTLVRRIARGRNSGVILCSHLLSEVESVCDDVVILSAGQIVAKGTVSEVVDVARKDKAGGARVRVPEDSLGKAQSVLRAMPHVESVVASGETPGWIEVALAGNGNANDAHVHTNAVLDCLIRSEISVLSFESEHGGLQDVFFQLTEG